MHDEVPAQSDVMPQRPPQGPPVRPAMSDRTPPPISGWGPMPVTIAAARAAAFFSFLLGGVVVVFAFLWREERVESLATFVAEVAPDRAESTLERAAEIVLWGAIGAIAFVIVVEALLLAGALRRRGVVRWLQPFTLALHALVGGGAVVFLAGDPDALWMVVLLVAQFVSAFASAVLLLLPGSVAWFRAGRDDRRRRRRARRGEPGERSLQAAEHDRRDLVRGAAE